MVCVEVEYRTGWIYSEVFYGVPKKMIEKSLLSVWKPETDEQLLEIRYYDYEDCQWKTAYRRENGSEL